MKNPQSFEIKVKVALFGNIANNFFRLMNAMRDQNKYSFTLYVDSNSENQSLPFNDNYSALIFDNFHIKEDVSYDLKSVLLGNFDILRELKKHDIVLFSSLNVILAPLVQGPIKIFIATGNDLTVFPFLTRYLKHQKWNSVTKFLRYTMIHVPRALFYSASMRLALKSVNAIVIMPNKPMKSAIERLNLLEKLDVDTYLPLAVDINYFNPQRESNKNIQGTIENFQFLNKSRNSIFYASRILIASNSDDLDSGDYKGTDKLILGFADFVKRTNLDVYLFLIDRKDEAPGQREMLEKIIKDNTISENVIWLRSTVGDSLDMAQMFECYKASTLVAIDFSYGAFGSAFLEAASMNKHILSYIDQDQNSFKYSWWPHVNCSTRNEISEQMESFFSSGINFVDSSSRRWILEYHSPESINILYSKFFEKYLPKGAQNFNI